jgi:mRNA interferase RelE/StbE
MKVIFLESFEKDLKRLKEKKTKKSLLNLIEQIKKCESMLKIKNLKKIKGSQKFYRVKMGDYRVGIKIEEETVTFIRFLHRKEIYRYFP